MNLLPQQRKKRELSDQQQAFLTALFDNGGNFSRACEVSGYSQGSIGYLKESLADEIIEPTASTQHPVSAVVHQDQQAQLATADDHRGEHERRRVRHPREQCRREPDRGPGMNDQEKSVNARASSDAGQLFSCQQLAGGGCRTHGRENGAVLF